MSAATDDRLRVLVRAVSDLSRVRTLPEVQAVVRTAARAIAGADGATFVLRDEDRCHYADEDAIGPLWKGQRFPLTACISGWAMLNAEAVAIPDIYADDRIPHDAYRPTFVQSLVMTPIRASDPIGAIGVYWSERHVADEDELEALQALADSTSVAMEIVDRVGREDAALRLAATDHLTGLRNRRGLEEQGAPLLEAERRAGRVSSVAYVDVDGLKRVNDLEGHEAGDALIALAARCLERAFRSADLIARVGGDEFAVLMPGCADGEQAVAERLSAALSPHQGRLSLSVGFAGGTGPLGELIDAADVAMYAARRARAAA